MRKFWVVGLFVFVASFGVMAANEPFAGDVHGILLTRPSQTLASSSG